MEDWVKRGGRVEGIVDRTMRCLCVLTVTDMLRIASLRHTFLPDEAHLFALRFSALRMGAVCRLITLSG